MPGAWVGGRGVVAHMSAVAGMHRKGAAVSRMPPPSPRLAAAAHLRDSDAGGSARRAPVRSPHLFAPAHTTARSSPSSLTWRLRQTCETAILETMLGASGLPGQAGGAGDTVNEALEDDDMLVLTEGARGRQRCVQKQVGGMSAARYGLSSLCWGALSRPCRAC